jgi:hypothetical protein
MKWSDRIRKEEVKRGATAEEKDEALSGGRMPDEEATL